VALSEDTQVLAAEEREARRKEQARERERRYRLRHPEKVRAKKRRYRARHPERVQEQQRQNYAAHREERREYSRRYTAEGRNKRPCVGCGEPCLGHTPAARCCKCAALHYRGDRHWNYKGGCIRRDGYRYVGWNGVRQLEHQLIWESAYGPVPRGWLIHHLNGDKLDNRLRNLVPFPSAVHTRLHRLVAAGAFSLHQAAVEVRPMLAGKAPTLAEARKALRAQYRGDPGKQASYERKLLKPDWAGRMAPVERTYVLQVLYRAMRKLLAAMPRSE